MKNSNIIINDAKDIKYKLKEFEYSIKKIERARNISLIIFILIIAFIIGFAATYMYSNPIYPPICASLFILDFIIMSVFQQISRKKEKKLLIDMNNYRKEINNFFDHKRS